MDIERRCETRKNHESGRRKSLITAKSRPKQSHPGLNSLSQPGSLLYNVATLIAVLLIWCQIESCYMTDLSIAYHESLRMCTMYCYVYNRRYRSNINYIGHRHSPSKYKYLIWEISNISSMFTPPPPPHHHHIL